MPPCRCTQSHNHRFEFLRFKYHHNHGGSPTWRIFMKWQRIDLAIMMFGCHEGVCDDSVTLSDGCTKKLFFHSARVKLPVTYSHSHVQYIALCIRRFEASAQDMWEEKNVTRTQLITMRWLGAYCSWLVRARCVRMVVQFQGTAQRSCSCPNIGRRWSRYT